MGMPNVYQEPLTVIVRGGDARPPTPVVVIVGSAKPSAAKEPGRGMLGIVVRSVRFTGSKTISWLSRPDVRSF